ncbi:type III pantothenate kinase [Wenyingzhuangia sp. 2_MG-2023]|uniref:type III pantothenate kinase n=1 Tax=Wenyingzhuangia sp. 2_MG-2023 TaxID=3062639 RepID=UPI0026E11994|nr:type III pantothenate kinase [Wenyingzhuangia sp. 2_MG-2023]MDO6737220.1 type III pantothenate kinase [Wenyingzhuangia sp. 2_MG-2023]
MNLIIDEGNTRIKLAVFDKGQLVDIEYTKIESYRESVKRIITGYKIEAVILSSVTDEIISVFNEIEIKNKIILSYKTPLPFKISYETPNTLGVDRIALVAAAWKKNPNENSLIIDAGTCITYDFIDATGNYLGGAIAPGLGMRFKGMHCFTKKLPDLKVPEGTIGLIGKTTKQCMESGALNGMVFEIEGSIRAYQQKFKKVNIILTGGDANFLCKQLKNSIFVNSNFLLEGLNEVLTYQFKDEAKLK